MGALMPLSKRVFDIALALLLLVLLAPLIAGIALAVLVLDGRPVLHRGERMRAPGRCFVLWKFRTMRPASGSDRPLGGDQCARVTRLGRVLRDRRLDELPQLINILKGDLSFVGPRPPLPHYVSRFPALYTEVLRSRPGVTGLASLVFYGREEVLLAGCRTEEETDALFTAFCVPAKAQLDLEYQRNRSLWSDIRLIARTALVPLTGGRARLARGPACGGQQEQRLALAAIGAALR